MRQWIDLFENHPIEFLYHGTWRGNIDSILEDGITAPSYWGNQEIASNYADQYGAEGVIIRVPITDFNEDGLAPNEGLVHSLRDDGDETPMPSTWQESLDEVDSVVYHYTLEIDEGDIL